MLVLGLGLGLILITQLLAAVEAQTWCGKNYMSTSPIVPPGGDFPTPPPSNTPLLALRYSPSISPYLAEDASPASPLAGFLIDTPITFSHIVGAEPISLPDSHVLIGTLEVTITTTTSTGRKIQLTKGQVPLNTTKFELPFSLSHIESQGLVPRTEAYEISCSATFSALKSRSTHGSTTNLSFLPNPPPGSSATKMDLKTGALLARPADGSPGPYEPVFAMGFYTQFDNYLAANLSVLNELKSQGFTIVHPIPDFNNLTQLNMVLDRMQEVGLYLMYDMRNTYMNLTSVAEQVNMIKSRPNLLLWYSADEPDGTSDPLNATSTAQSLITTLDGGGYHPVSLVLNCENYFFTQYASGATIVLQDTYMIGNNVTFSSQWGTVCTPDYGDCGCDNCKGEFEDIAVRMDEFRERFEVVGWERTKAVWTVPQGFGNDTYWKRFPTGKEFVVQSVVGINHGALGVVSWDDPTTADIKNSASILAKSLPKMTPFIMSNKASFQQITINRIDIGAWTLGAETLVLATNQNYEVVTLDLQSLPPLVTRGKSGLTQVLDSGAKASRMVITFEEVGTGAFILK